MTLAVVDPALDGVIVFFGVFAFGPGLAVGVAAFRIEDAVACINLELEAIGFVGVNPVFLPPFALLVPIG